MAHGRIGGVQEKPKDSKRTLIRLMNYLAGNRTLLIIIVLLVIINITTGLLSSYMMRPIINDYIIPGNASGLIHMLLILLCIYIFGVAATNIEYRLMNVIGQKTATRIRMDLFSKMQHLPVSYFDTKQYGDLMSLYTNDMDKVSDVLTDNLADFITAGLTLVGILFFMLYISPLLTLVAVLVLPLMIYVPSLIIKRSKSYFKAQQHAIGQLNGYIEEKMSGQKVVKVFGAEKRVENDFEKLNNTLKKEAFMAQFFSGVMMPAMQSLTTLNFVFVTIVGALLAIFRGLDVGGLATFVQYTRQWGNPINQLATLYNELQSAIAGAERIFKVIDELPEPADVPNATAMDRACGNMEFRDVWFGYLPEKPVLKGISLSVRKGDKIALVGKTGAGKTTFLNMLPRFYDIQSGQITIDKVPIKELRRNDLRNMEAIVLQDTHLFTGTVFENIRYGRLDASDEEVIKAAKLTSAHSFIKRLPQGYNTVLENDGANLSQGQRQLLNIARSAVSDPSILLLDEATSNIDTRSEILIQQGLDKLMEGRTSFIIAHRLSTVKNADKILVIDDGQIVEMGSHKELIALRGKYFTLYENQFEEEK
ncbi:MAG: ABC transporter ATP-binding protein [Dysgonamonadaceae bacterium]